MIGEMWGRRIIRLLSELMLIIFDIVKAYTWCNKHIGWLLAVLNLLRGAVLNILQHIYAVTNIYLAFKILHKLDT